MMSSMETPKAFVQALRKAALVGASATALFTFAAAAQAQPDLVTNGNFSSTTNGPGQLGYNTAATDWSLSTSPGYTFLFAPGSADSTGANGQYGNLSLWGPNNGSANGLPAASPAGGNFVALDGDFQNAALQQTISGLTPGDQYAVSFYWAASQQEGFDGATQQYIAVSLGSETLDTPTYDLPSHGFSGWQSQTLDFTATSNSEVLSFLAVGNLPVPPFALLDGVSAKDTTSVPEGGASSTYLLLAGIVCFAVLFIVQRKRLTAAAKSE